MATNALFKNINTKETLINEKVCEAVESIFKSKFSNVKVDSKNYNKISFRPTKRFFSFADIKFESLVMTEAKENKAKVKISVTDKLTGGGVFWGIIFCFFCFPLIFLQLICYHLKQKENVKLMNETLEELEFKFGI